MLKTILKKIKLITNLNQDDIIGGLYGVDATVASKIIRGKYIDKHKNKLLKTNMAYIVNCGTDAKRRFFSSFPEMKELLDIFRAHKINEELIKELEIFYSEKKILEFYETALEYAGRKIYEERPIIFNDTREYIGIGYTEYINIITKFLKVQKFESVLLTIPDIELLWNVDFNISKRHFLDDKSEVLNRKGVDLLNKIYNNNKEKFIAKTELLVYRLYTYCCYEYVEKYFKYILNISEDSNSDELAFNKMLSLMKYITKSPEMKNVPQINNLSVYINEYTNYRCFSQDEREVKKEKLYICFFKLSCEIILLNSGCIMHKDFSLIPVDEEQSAIQEIYFVMNQALKESRHDSYEEDEFIKYFYVYNHFIKMSDEKQNIIANRYYEKFFRYINNPRIQSLLILSDFAPEVFALYRKFYENVKYKIYRKYENINDNAGLMHHDLTDSYIVTRYISNLLNKDGSINLEAKEEFERLCPDGIYRKFIIRCANDKDYKNIMALNNPIPPYRRSIYVKASEKDIKLAISKNMCYVIEELMSDDVKNIACVAIILRNIYSPNTVSELEDFNIDFMSKEYACKYYDIIKRPVVFFDFDSIITNDGKTEVGNYHSYRGLGFMRICLELCEQMAVHYNADYICSTVSTLNKPSKRNFLLNSYEIIGQTKYTLPENQTSDFYTYLYGNNSKSSDEEIKQYEDLVEKEVEIFKKVFQELNITPENYIKDRDVPRDFLVLHLHK